MASRPSEKRLRRMAEELSSNPPPGISGAPYEDNLMEWNAMIIGPADTHFAGGTFKLIMTFKSDFPFKPPRVKFLSRMFHPNIHHRSGDIYVDILRDQWFPGLSVAQILLSIQSLLDDPNPDEAINIEAARIYRENRAEYNRRVISTVKESWLDLGEEAKIEGIDLMIENPRPAQRNAAPQITPRTFALHQPASAEGSLQGVSKVASSSLRTSFADILEVVDPANPRLKQANQTRSSVTSVPLDSLSLYVGDETAKAKRDTGAKERAKREQQRKEIRHNPPHSLSMQNKPLPSLPLPLQRGRAQATSQPAHPPPLAETSSRGPNPGPQPHGHRSESASQSPQPFPLPERPDVVTSARPQHQRHRSERLPSNSESNSRAVSPPGKDGETKEVNDPSSTISRGEEEDAWPNLENLMTTYTALDLTGQVTIPDYRLQAHGGLAVVYRGLWNDATVAVKVLKFRKNGRADAYWDISNERRVRREINVWAALKHRNIIEFLGYSTNFADFPAMISPWCQEGTASEHLERQELIVHKRIRLDVGEGIDYLHRLKIIHGDVKPANVLVSDEGVAKLCDFGLVRLADWEGPAGMTTTSPYTGTERYKAPELFISPDNRRPVATFEGDIYSLGSIMLEFVERIYPFQRYTKTYELRDAIMDGCSPALRSETTHALTDRTGFFWDLLEACWSDPSDRPATGVVVDALDHFARTMPGF